MTTLVVLLPARPVDRAPADWQLGVLPFVLFNDQGQAMRTGSASLALLPRARRHVLLLGARDVVLLRASVPALKGPRLRLALPNLIEDQLISDASRCHCAVGPAPASGGEREIAVVDRAWMRFVVDGFLGEERASLRIVALMSCLPPAGEPGVAVTIVGQLGDSGGLGSSSVDVVFQDGANLSGLSVPGQALESTVLQFASGREIALRLLIDAPAQLHAPVDRELALWAADASPVALETVARRALTAGLDLCQFEFSAQSLKSSRNSLRRWRLPLALAAATVLVSVVGLNLDWLLLARERADLSARASSILLESFPKTTTVLDAPVQMDRDLASLRAASGQADSSDFLVLCDRLVRALGPMGPLAIASVDYADRALTVSFAADVAIDGQWVQRLDSVGLKAERSGEKWILRSAS